MIEAADELMMQSDYGEDDDLDDASIICALSNHVISDVTEQHRPQITNSASVIDMIRSQNLKRIWCSSSKRSNIPRVARVASRRPNISRVDAPKQHNGSPFCIQAMGRYDTPPKRRETGRTCEREVHQSHRQKEGDHGRFYLRAWERGSIQDPGEL